MDKICTFDFSAPFIFVRTVDEFPITVSFEAVSESCALAPITILFDPLVKFDPAELPIAILSLPSVELKSELSPIATLLEPVVLEYKEYDPRPLLL